MIDGTETRNNLAAINRAQPGTISSWNPDPKCVNESGLVCASSPPTIWTFARCSSPPMEPDIRGGYFNKIGSTNPQSTQRSAAEIALSDGAARAWSPLVTVNNSAALGTVHDVETRDLTNGATSTRWGTLLAGSFNVLKTTYSREGLAEVFRYGAYNADGWPGDWNPERDYTGAATTPPSAATWPPWRATSRRSASTSGGISPSSETRHRIRPSPVTSEDR